MIENAGDSKNAMAIAFGPVLSRRLGRILGINNIPPKVCSYSCLYCQVDAVDEAIWRKINRPHRSLCMGKILEGMREFARSYKCELATEMVLVEGINDLEESVKPVANFLAELRPSRAYLSVPTRPPAEDIRPSDEACMNRAFQIFGRRLDRVECLVRYEGEDFAFLGDAEIELLAITAVHSMSEAAVKRFLDQAGIGWSLVKNLIGRGGYLRG